jgi:RNA-directed DNA polymerase
VRKYRGTLLVKPYKSSVRTLLAEVRAIIRASGAMSAGQLVVRLNPLLRGWAHHHRHMVSSETFRNVDYAVWSALRLWARRRHSRRHRWWERYFLPGDGHRAVFTGTIEDRGQRRQVQIFRAGSVPIQRHVLIHRHANPFDPRWHSYFERRHAGRSVVKPRPLTRAFGEA